MLEEPSEIVKRIGILGASFDPIHFGHLGMAILALQTKNLDEVWLCPSMDRWDKKPQVNIETRIKWIKIALKNLERSNFNICLKLDELELEEFRGTYFFLNYLQKKYSKYSFSFILGTDSYSNIKKWRDPKYGVINGEDILKKYQLFLVPRVGTSFKIFTEENYIRPIILSELDAIQDYLYPIFGVKNISYLNSTMIRERIVKKLPDSPFCFSEVVSEIMLSNAYLTS